jgi:ribose transport system substrate-binding protein
MKLGEEKDVCLIGLWAYNPPALQAAVQEAGRAGKVKIVGFDDDVQTLQGIEAGFIEGTVVHNPYRMGQRAIQIAAALARKEKIDLPKTGVEIIPPRIVTREGGLGRLKAAEYRQELERLRGR